MITDIFSRDFYTLITDYALAYKDQRQCKLDWTCRVVYNEGYSIYDVVRMSDKNSLKARFKNAVNEAYDMGLVTDQKKEIIESYIDEIGKYLPTSALGYWIFKQFMNIAEKMKRRWVEKLYRR